MGAKRRDSDREHFNTIADAYSRKDTTPSSRFARLHRLDRTLSSVSLRPGCSVLEVGCGAGLAAGYLEGRCGRYLGIDHSARLIDFARAGHVGDGIDFRATGVEELTGVGGFDLAFTIGVLHHLENAVAAVSKIVGLLKPGGYFVANEPQPANQVVSAARRMRNRFDRTYSVDQDELSQSELRGILEGAGLTAVKVTAQGVFSTPFAEVVMGPQVLTAPAARLACRVDGFLERKVPGLLKYLSWNLIAVGQKPGAGAVADVPAPEG